MTNLYEQLERRLDSSRNQATRNFLSIILSDLLNFLKSLLQMSIFFSRFLEWWYSSEYAKRPGVDNRVDVPPPDIIAVMFHAMILTLLKRSLIFVFKLISLIREEFHFQNHLMYVHFVQAF